VPFNAIGQITGQVVVFVHYRVFLFLGFSSKGLWVMEILCATLRKLYVRWKYVQLIILSLIL